MKKILLFAAVMVLISGAISEAAYYENDGDTWETAYVIASSEDLILMRDRVNNGTEITGKYYKLDTDIDMTSVTSWQPVGTLKYFTGHFDGQGHTIQINHCLFSLVSSDRGTSAVSNLNIIGTLSNDEAGLVYTLDSGIIENCTFSGSVRSENEGTSSGGIAQRVNEGGIIRNCTVSADIFSSNSKSAGGIAGEVIGGAIENCTVESETVITASEDAGGIAGYIEQGITAGCTVESGTVITAQRYSGGIAGSSNTDVTFSGDVYPAEYTMVGNIPYWNGDNDGSSWEKAYILVSSADLYVMRERVEAGSEDAGKYYKLSADIDFHVKERQHIRGSYWGEPFTGHFDGQNHTVNLDTDESLFYVISPDEGTIAVRNLNITGAVNGNIYSNSALAWRLISGIIENCTFRGNISSNNSYASGLIADMRGGTIQNCTVSADISNAYSNGISGGIVGYMISGKIESCTVQAGTAITASNDAGGIAGQSYIGTISGCNVETGTSITASVNAGGIAGFVSSGSVSLSGNSWPSEYPEIGSDTSAEALKSAMAAAMGSSSIKAVPASAYRDVSVSTITADDNLAKSRNIHVAARFVALDLPEDGVYYMPITCRAIPEGRMPAPGAVFVFYPDGITGVTTAYCKIFDKSGNEVTDPSSIADYGEYYIAFEIADGATRAAAYDSSSALDTYYILSNPTVAVQMSSGAYYDIGNDGSSWENAYIIASSEDLLLMCDRVSSGDDGDGKYYMLSADIDISSVTNWRGIGNGKNFTGHFDGQGHTITLSTNRGLFDTVSSDKDTVAVRKLNITGNVNDNGGALVYTLYSGIIEDCNFTGAIGSASDDAIVINSGGLVECMHGGTVRNCSVSADISSAEGNAGGIAGVISGGSIEYCTVKAGTAITASGNAGGIAGSVSGGSIEYCTVEDGVSITGTRAGGITGSTGSGSTLSGNKWPSGYTESGSSENSVPGTESGHNTSANPQITWNGHTYQVFSENLTWEEAKSRCESLGGHLVTITSTLEQSQIETLLRQSRTDYASCWIGANADGKGWWNWVTDEVFEKQYANFAAGQPDGSGNYLCLYWNISGVNIPGSVIDTVSNSGKWDDTTNNGSDSGITSHGFICEWDETPQAVESAPAASDFQTWQQDPDAWRRDPQSNVPSGANPSPVDTSHLTQNPPDGENISLPVSFDARQKNLLQPVRYQGIFRTCWAFAALGAMEADYMTKGMTSLGTSPDLSELHLAWFTYKDPSSDSYKANERYIYDDELSSFLMKGGDPDIAVAFLSKTAVSPVSENEMPYNTAGASDKTADQNIRTFLNGRGSDGFRKSDISLSDVNNIGQLSANDTDMANNIKKQIMEHGAVYFSYGNDENGYSDDGSSFYSYSARDGSHAALLVGWDDNYPASNFRQNPGSNGAWLVRTSRWNNYGSDEASKTGDDEYGCFWMSYAQAGTPAGINDLRSFSVREEKQAIQENGSTIHTKDITSSWGARIFTAGRNERLIRVSFHTTDNNVKYQLFVNKFGKKVPTDPGRAENPLSEGEFAYAGYHTVTLSEPVDLFEGDYYAVILKMTLFASSNYRYPAAVEASIDKYIEMSADVGESFFAEGAEVPSVWQDGVSVDGGPYKACITTFTEERITYDTKPAIITDSLPSATVNQSYMFALSSSGTQKIEWRSGNIPEDFALSREGVLSGNPTKAGQYDINLTAVNDVGYVEKTLALTVKSSASSNTTINDTPENNTPENNTPNNEKPSDDTPTDNESADRLIGVGSSSSGGGCNSGIFAFACGVILLTVKKKRG